MANYSAQGSISIKKLRNGDTISLWLDTTKALFQGVNDKDNTVFPNWKEADNQPTITPKAESVRGSAATLAFHQWQYNGINLQFDGEADDSGYKLDTVTKKFRMHPDTGALKIIDNLASSINVANDTLTYSGQVTVAGVETNVSKSIDIVIRTVGGTSYNGTITASPTSTLTSSVTKTTLTTELWMGAADITDYYVKWKRDNEDWTAHNGKKSIDVTGEDVNGKQLIIAEFYLDSASSTPVAKWGIYITDTADEYSVVCYAAGGDDQVSENNPVRVEAKVVRYLPDNNTQQINPTPASWRFDIYGHETWNLIKTKSMTISDSADTAFIDVTSAEVANGDVEVIAEVEW